MLGRGWSIGAGVGMWECEGDTQEGFGEHGEPAAWPGGMQGSGIRGQGSGIRDVLIRDAGMQG